MGDRVQLVSARNEEWAARYTAIAACIADVLPDAEIRHIGSTAVAGFESKDVVDVVVGVHAAAVSDAVNVLSASGFDLEGERSEHAWLSSPDRQDRPAIIHVVVFLGEQWRRRLAFRDLLRRDPAARRRYLAVKRAAAAATNSWGDYTARKASVVSELLNEVGPANERR
ncbi:GrpB family protein [Microbacterium sp. A588]